MTENVVGPPSVVFHVKAMGASAGNVSETVAGDPPSGEVTLTEKFVGTGMVAAAATATPTAANPAPNRRSQRRRRVRRAALRARTRGGISRWH
jgi:hypothetical protein